MSNSNPLIDSDSTESTALLPFSLRYGLTTGLIEIVALYLLYLISTEALLGGPAMAIWVIVMALIIYFAKQIRNLNGGYFTFGQAFLNTFAIAMAAVMITAIFNYVLYNFLAPELADEVKRIAIQNIEKVMGMLGNGEAMDKAMEEIEKEDFNFTFMKMLQQIFFSAIGWGLFSAIVAAFLKKRKEEFLM